MFGVHLRFAHGPGCPAAKGKWQPEVVKQGLDKQVYGTLWLPERGKRDKS